MFIALFKDLNMNSCIQSTNNLTYKYLHKKITLFVCTYHVSYNFFDVKTCIMKVTFNA